MKVFNLVLNAPLFQTLGYSSYLPKVYGQSVELFEVQAANGGEYRRSGTQLLPLTLPKSIVAQSSIINVRVTVVLQKIQLKI